MTWAEFDVFIDDGGYEVDAWWEGLAKRVPNSVHPRSIMSDRDFPRTRVTWYEAAAFCRWLSEKLAQPISLPTEQQWQRAAQGDDRRAYPWGRSFDATRCNTCEDHQPHPTPVDTYLTGVSPFGVMDMSGNVWEWCRNEYANPGNADLHGEIPCVIRGGSFATDKEAAQVTYRHSFNPIDYAGDLGFRVVRTIPDPDFKHYNL
jgi:formylglycine-generating enzyme required for sulfatase activity